ncbi:MAG: Gfo/Idh/MocA family oxidoreductase [Chloroflexi bacterium]|nr:Gfo/Idh/MocA family oxidoreductase [Chloroflexota bacterium]
MNSKKQVRVGIIGTGNISTIYLKNAAWLTPFTVLALADLRHEAAVSKAQVFNIPRVASVDELLADPTIDMVLNLTTPDVHGRIGLQALHAGKSVYNEKPLALHLEEAQEMLQLAQDKGLRVGSAPDTFLGAGIQTCRKLIDDGEIGHPVAATAFMMEPGHESWHPNPEFYYKPGGGPMFDMGPYYLTALVSLLGPVTAVSGMVSKGQLQRTITSQPLAGQFISVDVPTHVAGLMTFANGTVGTIVTSFDVQGHEHPHIEIYGTEATLSVPDPNTFGGVVRIKRVAKSWQETPHTHSYAQNVRGLGLADMAEGWRNGRDHRANGHLAYHVLELMWAFHNSADSQQHITLSSSCSRPEAMPRQAPFGQPVDES